MLEIIFELGYYSIDCGAVFNIDLTIGGTNYTLTEKEMVVNNGNNICIFSVDNAAQNKWTFGTLWFRAYCNILDYSNKRPGFEKVINS